MSKKPVMSKDSPYAAIRGLYDIFGRLKEDLTSVDLSKVREIDLKQSKTVHKNGWSGEANLWLFRLF